MPFGMRLIIQARDNCVQFAMLKLIDAKKILST